MKHNTLLIVKILFFVFLLSVLLVSCNQEGRQKPVKAKTIMFQPKEIISISNSSEVTEFYKINNDNFPDLYNLRIGVTDYKSTVELSCDNEKYDYYNLSLVRYSGYNHIYTFRKDNSIYCAYRNSKGEIHLITEEAIYKDKTGFHIITFKPVK